MAMNQIQFQPGLSMPEFFDLYGTESQCAQALQRARWPSGFRCPRCDGVAHCVLRGGTFKVFQCDACRHQTSLIAGTVFQGTKLALSVWFLAIFLISQAKTGLSALALKRHLGVSYPTAWLMHHKLMLAMATREDGYVLCGDVQVDDALPRRRAHGRQGRAWLGEQGPLRRGALAHRGRAPAAPQAQSSDRIHPERDRGLGQEPPEPRQCGQLRRVGLLQRRHPGWLLARSHRRGWAQAQGRPRVPLGQHRAG